jgi:NAD(P)-dependent dehydrogenase (short-subunit alcohol dehydrogenase family)
MACARLLAERGNAVAIADLNLPAAEALAHAIGGAPYRVDVRSADELQSLAERIDDEVGPVEMLVNSAGIIQGDPVPPHDLALEMWDRVVETDLRGTYAACVAFGTRMARRGRGSIVNIASMAGIMSTPLHAYGPAKAAVAHLSRSLAAEWGPAGVRVNAVSPGYVMTDIIKDAIAKGLRDPALLEQGAALGRLVTPEQVARAILFLLSDEASAVTGIDMLVDNGFLAGHSWRTYGGLRNTLSG